MINRKMVRRLLIILDIAFIAIFLVSLYYTIIHAYSAGFYSVHEQISIIQGLENKAIEWQHKYVEAFWYMLRDIGVMAISLVWIIFRSLRNELLLGRRL